MEKTNNISIKTSSECAGCTACKNECPRHAISMNEDSLGFKYPVVDDSLCNNCGKCLRICPFDKREDKAINTQHYYALRHSDIYELSLSQSGGAFAILSDIVIENGGIVYGAGFDTSFRVSHLRAHCKAERDKLRYSKYVQSDLNDIFIAVKDDLNKGRVVLFSGTPCQVAGLLAAVNNKLRDNLITIDLICHGVSSPAIWQSYLKYIRKKYGDFEYALFRDKSMGWKSHFESFVYKDHKITRKTFASLFYSSLALRESCYNCVFTNYNRPSDITIADLWGWKSTPDEINDNKGISVVFTNTTKGDQLLKSAQKNHFLLEINSGDFDQPQLHAPIPRPENRDQFEKDFCEYGFKYIGLKYADLGLKAKIKDFLRPFYYKLKHIR